MPRYLIERTFTVDVDEMPVVGRRSKEVARDSFPEIVWEHSHVTISDAGIVRTYCVYAGPSEQAIRDHAAMLGQHAIDAIHEIAGDVSPADFPD